MSPDRRRLLDMLLHAREAAEFLGGLTEAELASDRKTQAAVIRSLEVLGEAAGKVSRETRAKATDVPWGSIVALRNVLIHDYARLEMGRLRDVVVNDLPPLIASIERLLAEHPE